MIPIWLSHLHYRLGRAEKHTVTYQTLVFKYTITSWFWVLYEKKNTAYSSIPQPEINIRKNSVRCGAFFQKINTQTQHEHCLRLIKWRQMEFKVVTVANVTLVYSKLVHQMASGSLTVVDRTIMGYLSVFMWECFCFRVSSFSLLSVKDFTVAYFALVVPPTLFS